MTPVLYLKLREIKKTLRQHRHKPIDEQGRGVVEEAGPDVCQFRKGDEIYGVTNPQFCGANAQYAVAQANMVALRPLRLSQVEAASERAPRLAFANFPQSIAPTQWSRAMTDSEQHRAKLQQLNRNFIRSVDEADVAWFDANLATDFFSTNPDGTFIDRKAFLAQIARGSSVKNIREHEVLIRILGDFAIIHARISYQKPDGTEGAGRYTDDWQLRGGRWQCVSAHYLTHPAGVPV
jgi:Domain of unknown function (DUF4440)